MIVFLADLQNSYYRYIRNSVPIGMGYVYAYLHKVFGKELEIHQFRKFEEMAEVLKERTPDLVLFGSYSWNTLLTLKSARYLRERYPSTVIAVGGPDVSQVVSMTERELRAHPEVDFYLPNEGEGPARLLVEAMFAATRFDAVRGTAIKGCLSLSPDSAKVLGSVMDRFETDINEIPSPYLDGFMDRFLAEKDYLGIIQTSRGCPYRCTFCVSGKDTWSKVKMFDMERVKAEIDYVAARAANPYLRLADENFGILKRDPEIADYIVAKRQQTGFPAAVSIYTDKHPTDRVKYINKTMRDILPFCISFQSTTGDVLENIKRINLKEHEIQGAVHFARENRLTLVTELIFPLPGETRHSFLDSIDRLMSQRFDSIVINHTRILKGTEMDLPEDRAKHGIVTRFHMSENGYTHHADMENIEIDESVMANNTISYDEVHETNRFVLLFDFAHYRGLLKELLFLFECHGVRATELLTRCAADREKCPTLSDYASRYADGLEAMMFDGPASVIEHVRREIKTNPAALFGIAELKNQLTNDLLMNGKLDAAIEEAVQMGLRLYTEKHGTPTLDVLEEVATIRQVIRLSFIPFGQPVPEEVVILTPFDLNRWAGENYARPLSAYRGDKPTRLALRVPNYEIYKVVWANAETIRNKYSKFTKSINSASRRRVLSLPTEKGVEVPDSYSLSA